MSMTFNINDIIKRLVYYQLLYGDIEIRLSNDYYETSYLLELLADAMQEIEIKNSVDEIIKLGINKESERLKSLQNLDNMDRVDNVIPFRKRD